MTDDELSNSADSGALPTLPAGPRSCPECARLERLLRRRIELQAYRDNRERRLGRGRGVLWIMAAVMYGLAAAILAIRALERLR